MSDDTFDVDAWLAELKPRTAEARVLRPRPDLRVRHAELEAELQAAMLADHNENREPQAPVIAQQITDLEAEIEAAEVTVFRFKSLGTRGWHDLLAKHPPTKEQKRLVPNSDYNPATFPAVAVAASSEAPKLTLAQARALESQLDLTEFDKLWQAVLAANVGGDGLPKSILAGTILRRSDRSGITVSPEESPDPSSSVE